MHKDVCPGRGFCDHDLAWLPGGGQAWGISLAEPVRTGAHFSSQRVFIHDNLQINHSVSFQEVGDISVSVPIARKRVTKLSWSHAF